MEYFTCDICNKTYNRKDNLRYHIVEVHCGNKKKCKHFKKKMRSPSLKRHMEYSCAELKKKIEAKKKAEEESKYGGKVESKPNETVDTEEIEKNEAFFRSFLNESNHDPLINGRANDSLPLSIGEYFKNFKE